MEMFKKAVLILGGNQGEREELLDEARKFIGEENRVLLQSQIYETEAWGNVAEGNFLNQVIQISTNHSPLSLLAFIQQIELQLGRERFEKWGNRTMDIDILFWDDEVIRLPELIIPHPFIQDRRFVLLPLCEILPDMVHPVLHKPIHQLLKECEDKSLVRKFEY